ncbi:MAG: FkbM family methyltransferase [Candidatus Binatus sp.]|uniref:FkbM family methyltransferase n=1 Tax=Candidatus Binatus sp. TaxID=2811406 RepID=UPI003C7844AC
MPNRRAASRRLSPSTYTARRTCPYSSTPFIPPPLAPIGQKAICCRIFTPAQPVYPAASVRDFLSGAYKPDPQSASALEANVRVNGWQDRITVIRAAVGQSSGQVRFAAARGMESRIETRSDSGDGVITVRLVTLDGALAGGRIDVIKIDVEGFEQQVIQGARTILTEERRRPRAILVEVHPFAWAEAGTTSASFLGLLDELGFKVEDMRGAAVSSISEYGHVIALRK